MSEKIERLEQKLAKHEQSLKGYQTLFESDGFISPKEQKQLDRMNNLLARIRTKIAKVKAKQKDKKTTEPTSTEPQDATTADYQNLTASTDGQLGLTNASEDTMKAAIEGYNALATSWNAAVKTKAKGTPVEEMIALYEGLIEKIEEIIAKIVFCRTTYEELKDEFSMSFKYGAKAAVEELENKVAKSGGWTDMLNKYIEERVRWDDINAEMVIVETRIEAYRAIQPQWDSRVIPNINALLVEQEDIEIVTAIKEAMEAIVTAINAAPENIQSAYEKWITVAETANWAGRLAETEAALENTIQKNNSKLKRGNPELAPTDKDITYVSVGKRKPIAREGAGDTHKIAANDVQQGDLDDCYVVGSLAALAKAVPDDLEKIIKPKEDGTFDVTLHLRTDPDSPKRTATVVNVNRDFVIEKGEAKDHYAGKGDNELWVKILEKAYAQAMGGYDAFKDGGSPEETLQVFTGKEVLSGRINTTMNKEETLALFEQALKDKKAINLGSLKYKGDNPNNDMTRTPSNQLVTYDHNYYLDRIEKETLYINNPKGSQHLILEWDEFTQYFIKYFKVK